MSMKIGTKAIQKIMIGDKEVQKIVIDGDVVYTNGPQPTKYTVMIGQNAGFGGAIQGNTRSSSPYGFTFWNGLSNTGNWNGFISQLKNNIATTFLMNKHNSEYQSLYSLYLNHETDISNIKITNINITPGKTVNRLYGLYRNGAASNSQFNNAEYITFTQGSGNMDIHWSVILDSTYPDLQFAFSNYAWVNSWQNVDTWNSSTITFEFTSPYLEELLASAID